MPEEDPAVVQRFQVWAYTGTIMPSDEDISKIRYRALIKLYIFAEKYDIPDLQNSAMDTILLKMEASQKTPMGLFAYVYEHTRSTSPLRRLFVNRVAQMVNLDTYFARDDPEAEFSDFPLLFMIDLAREQYRLLKGKAKHDWRSLDCTFHVHPSASTEFDDLAKQ